MEPGVKVREGGIACAGGTTRVACSRWRRALLKCDQECTRAVCDVGYRDRI